MLRLSKALWAAIMRFNDRNAFSASAHIAMALMLAVFPFTLFALSIAGILGSRVDPQNIVDLIFGTWPDAVAEPILREVEAVTRQSGSTTLTIGILLTLLFASNGVEAIRLAITAAYRDTDPRPIWTTRILSLGFVLGGALVLIGIAILQVVLPLYLGYFDGVAFSGLNRLLASDPFRNIVTVAFLAFAVTACHLWLPGHRQPLRVILPGVALTLCLWAAVGFGFSYYLDNLANYSVTYAGLAGIMAALIFLNLMAAIFILGADFNARLKEMPR